MLLFIGVVCYLLIVLSIIVALYLIYKNEESHSYLDVPTDTEIKVPSKQFHYKKLEGVVTCVGYADFLKWTLPFNKQHFDRLVVVTSPEDVETQEVCRYWHVECLVTDAFHRFGGFNKGKGINEGLNALDKDGWVMHFDADIYLPPRTRDILQMLPLNAECLYGIDRMNCVGFENFIKYLQNPDSIHGNDGFLRLSQFPLGSRLLNLERDGYIPIGFLQLWCPIMSGVITYPDFHTGADRTDALFVYNWKREKRQIIPEIICLHLESEDSIMGVNWNGRKSKRFE